MTPNRTSSTKRVHTLLLFIVLMLVTVPALGQVLLQSDFETNPGTQPHGWGLLFGGAQWGTDIAASSEHAHSGDWSIKLVDLQSDRGIGLRSDLIPITDVGPFRAELYLRNDDTGWGTVYLEFWNDRGIRVAEHIVGGAGRNQWDHVVVEAPAPSDAVSVSVLLYSSGPAVGSVYFDDVTLTRVQPDSTADQGDYSVNYTPLREDAIASLGQPLQWSQLGSSAQGWDLEGTPTWYYTSPGAGNDSLYAVRIPDGKLLGVYPFPGGGGQSWDMVPLRNGDVYFSAGSTLFKFDHSEGTVITVGRPYSNTGMIWGLDLDPDGVLYGATYPDARVFKLIPGEDRIIDMGSVSPQEYARSMAASDRYLFIGLGPVTDLIAYDKQTGESISILPERYKGKTGFVRFTEIRGNRLFASAGDDTNVILIYDIETLEVVHDLTSIATPISPADEDGVVYYRQYTAPYRYDLATDTFRQRGLIQPEASALGFSEIDESLIPEARRSRFQGPNLVGLQRGQFWALNLDSYQLLQVPVEIYPTPIRINSMAATGDKVYGGGITPGALFIRDTKTGETTFVPPANQTDSVVMYGDKLYFGTYTGANIKVYDMVSEQITTLGTAGNDQDRPVAMIEHQGKIYVGTVPAYGLLGGALAVVDTQTHTIRSTRNVVPDHSIVALTATDGIVYGGTSTLGGLGHDRAPGDAALFAWDTATGSALWTEKPLENEVAIGALVVGPDGLLWGAGTHSVFAYDTAARKVVWQQQLRAASAPAYTWREAFAATYGQYVLLTLNREYMVIADTDANTVTVVPGNYDRIVVDEDGNLYFTRGSELYMVPHEVWTALN